MSDDVTTRLADDWREAGVQRGDLFLLHSNLRRTFRRIAELGGAPAPELVIESLLHALGPEGTLLLPLFNFDFTRGVPFDMRHTPSQMGLLTEVGRAWPGAVRTGHPIYSFAVIGARAEAFRGLANDSGYGADSPFGVLHREGGRIGVIDLPDQNSMTFYHYVEESCAAPYRYHKRFRGPYIDTDGTQAEREFGLFVRDVERGVATQVDPMGERLWAAGLYRGCRPREGSGMRTIAAAPMFDAVAEVLRSGRAEGLLYAIQ